MKGNNYPVSFRFGLELLKTLDSRCKSLGGISRNFYVYVLVKSHLNGVTLTDEEILSLWRNRGLKLDELPL